MRTARKLTLLAALAVAAAAIAAPSAHAQREPLAHNQTPRLIVQQEIHAANDVNCPLVTPTPAPDPAPLLTAGGCRVHITSPADSLRLVFHTAGGAEAEDSECGFEADMRIDSAGEGYLAHQELTGGAACQDRACGQLTPPMSEGRAWSFYMQETEPAPRERMILLLCIEDLAGTVDTHCEFSIPLTYTATHRYRATATDITEHNPLFTSCEFNGDLNFETASGNTGEAQARQNVEIRHT